MMNAFFTHLLLVAALVFGSTFTSSAYGGSWQLLDNLPPFQDATNPLLLTDGRVFVQGHDGNTDMIQQNWVLTPDETGSYVNGTWTQIASLEPSETIHATFMSRLELDTLFQTTNDVDATLCTALFFFNK